MNTNAVAASTTIPYEVPGLSPSDAKPWSGHNASSACSGSTLKPASTVAALAAHLNRLIDPAHGGGVFFG